MDFLDVIAKNRPSTNPLPADLAPEHSACVFTLLLGPEAARENLVSGQLSLTVYVKTATIVSDAWLEVSR